MNNNELQNKNFKNVITAETFLKTFVVSSPKNKTNHFSMGNYAFCDIFGGRLQTLFLKGFWVKILPELVLFVKKKLFFVKKKISRKV